MSRTNEVDEGLLLPSLDEGITLLDVEGGRGVAVLQSLVLDHLLMPDGPAFWVDAHGYATTTSLTRITPNQRLLDRIFVARGFTVYQHYGALCDLTAAVENHVKDSSVGAMDVALPETRHDSKTSPTPSLIVAPAFEVFYRENDTLSKDQSETLQARALARLLAYTKGYDVPVLVTRSNVDEFTNSIETVADNHLVCEQTRMGSRFTGEDFEMLVYPIEDGYYQTTFAYWRQLLSARATQVGLQQATPRSPAIPTQDVGQGVMVDGSSKALTANPLSDALTASKGW